MMGPIIIAVDGYSSTGKSTFAKAIARMLGYTYIDTGAMYRMVALWALRKGCIGNNNAIDTAKLENLLNNTEEAVQVWINGEKADREIRSLEVSEIVSPVSALPFVRRFVDARLRELGRSKAVVMDGRDIGTVVFPDAELKIFMTAKPEVRATRRFEEMRAKGEDVTYEEILSNLQRRDYLDEHRKLAPLKRAEDAILLDNSDMTLEDQLCWFRKLIEDRKLCRF